LGRVVKVKQTSPLSNEDIVFQYFRCIEKKDLEGALSLFDYDAVIYEPFSKSAALKGKSSIEPFLKVAMMANNSLKRTIKIEKPSSMSSGDANNASRVVALITFEKGDKVRGRFTFEFDTERKKIRVLHIEFL
jgi:ketosteroid isomerase-like protein